MKQSAKPYKLGELGGEDPLIDQTITKLLDYATDRHRNDLEAIAAGLHALDIGHRQQAKFWELRAATSLSQLWQRQGKREAAYQVLAAIYGWFTEGFDTADLLEARALLEQ